MKRIISLLFVTVICFTMVLTTSGFADNGTDISSDRILRLPNCPIGTTMRIPVGNAEYIETAEGQLLKISDLPHFYSQKEAASYIQNIKIASAYPVRHPIRLANTLASNYNYRVASVTYNYLNTVALWVDYTTSGASHTGVVTYHNAYTTFTGFTLGIAWHEISCHSEVTSSGKDILASAHGELAYYLLVDGFIELGREAVNLSGSFMAVR